MEHNVPNDRDRETITEHKMAVVIDPQLETDVIVRTDGLLLRLDVDPTRLGQVVRAYLRTARRIALDELEGRG